MKVVAVALVALTLFSAVSADFQPLSDRLQGKILDKNGEVRLSAADKFTIRMNTKMMGLNNAGILGAGPTGLSDAQTLGLLTAQYGSIDGFTLDVADLEDVALPYIDPEKYVLRVRPLESPQWTLRYDAYSIVHVVQSGSIVNGDLSPSASVNGNDQAVHVPVNTLDANNNVVLNGELNDHGATFSLLAGDGLLPRPPQVQWGGRRCTPKAGTTVSDINAFDFAGSDCCKLAGN